MLPSDKDSKVTLEDLLHLKRAERPSPEFWSKFEQELRQKQLTALVQKRRWWHDLPVLLNRRVYVPAGAAAIVAFTLVTVRYSSSGPLAQIENTAPKIMAADPAVEMLPATVVTVADHSARRLTESAAPASAHPDAVVAASAETTERAELLPMPARIEETPSARSIAANLARLEQSEPDLVNAVLGSRLSSPVRAQPASATTTVAAESDSPQRYRLIARYTEHSLSPEPSAPVLVRERIARRLGDDITERISRIGVEGSRVSLKF
jgi:hypothetical protein